MADPPKKRRRRAVLALVVLALAALAAGLPALLSTPPLRSATRAWLARGLGAPLAFDDVDLSWFGPTTFRGLTVGGRGRFADDALLQAGAATLGASFPDLLFGAPPPDLTAEDVELRVTRDAAGAVDWAVSFGDLLPGEGGLRVVLRRARVRVAEAAAGTIAWLEDVDLEVDTRDPAAWRVALEAKSETPGGRGALLARAVRDEGGRVAVEGVARGFELGWYEPLLAAFVEGAELAGLLDLDLNATVGPGPRLDGTASGTLQGFRLIAPAWTGLLPVQETLVRCEGGLGADFAAGVFSFDGFHLSSSFVELIGDGVLRVEDDGLVGDAALHFNADCARAVRRIRPLLLELAPFRNVTGGVDVRLEPKEGGPRGRFDLAVTLEHFALQPRETLHLPIGTSALYADAAWSPRTGELSLGELRTEARWADAEGRLDVTWPGDGRPFALYADLAITSNTRDLASFLHVVFPGVPLLMAGPLEATFRARVDESGRSARVGLASEWFDVGVDHDRGGGRIDSYNFFGKPFEATLDVAVPAGAARPLEAATGRLEVDAPACSIYRNELEEFRLDAAIDGGTATLERWTARGFGGTMSAAGAFAFAGDAPGLRLELKGEDLEIEDRFPAWFAACVAPVFAARPGPFAVENDMRLDGWLEVAADGRLLREWLDTLRGEGRASMTGTTVEGSPLLQALVEPYGQPGPRRVDSIETVLSIDEGRIRSTPVVRLADGGELLLQGETNGRGELSYQVSAESIFGPAFFAEHRMLLPPDLFRIEGRYDRPSFLLPNPGTWRALARKGELEEAIRELRRP